MVSQDLRDRTGTSRASNGYADSRCQPLPRRRAVVLGALPLGSWSRAGGVGRRPWGDGRPSSSRLGFRWLRRFGVESGRKGCGRSSSARELGSNGRPDRAASGTCLGRPLGQPPTSVTIPITGPHSSPTAVDSANWSRPSRPGGTSDHDRFELPTNDRRPTPSTRRRINPPPTAPVSRYRQGQLTRQTPSPRRLERRKTTTSTRRVHRHGIQAPRDRGLLLRRMRRLAPDQLVRNAGRIIRPDRIR